MGGVGIQAHRASAGGSSSDPVPVNDGVGCEARPSANAVGPVWISMFGTTGSAVVEKKAPTSHSAEFSGPGWPASN